MFAPSNDIKKYITIYQSRSLCQKILDRWFEELEAFVCLFRQVFDSVPLGTCYTLHSPPHTWITIMLHRLATVHQVLYVTRRRLSRYSGQPLERVNIPNALFQPECEISEGGPLQTLPKSNQQTTAGERMLLHVGGPREQNNLVTRYNHYPASILRRQELKSHLVTQSALSRRCGVTFLTIIT